MIGCKSTCEKENEFALSHLISVTLRVFEVLQHLEHLLYDGYCRMLRRSRSVVDTLEVRVGFIFHVLRELLLTETSRWLRCRRANRTCHK